MAPADEQRSQTGKNKRKRQSKYLQHGGKKSTISAGVQGFLITCVASKEFQSIKEAINLLDQFSESPVVGRETTVEGESSSMPVPGDSSENGPFLKGGVESGSVPPDAEADGGNSSETSEDSDGENLGWAKARRLEESSSPRGSCASGDNKHLSEEASNSRRKLLVEATKGVDELLAAELEELRDTKKTRFVGYQTGCNGVIFVRMHLEKGEQRKGPQEIAEAIVREAATTKKSRSRFCMRLLPVELTCYASPTELEKVAGPLILQHFPKGPDQPAFKFAVVCESRANTNLNKMDFINVVAKMVPEPHSVDLKNPDKTILVQIVKTACAIGVVRNFKELAKYNLRQLTSPAEVQTRS